MKGKVFLGARGCGCQDAAMGEIGWTARILRLLCLKNGGL